MRYNDYINLISKVENFPVVGTNEWGENVMIEHYNGEDPYFKITTFQNNSWTRIIYLYQNGNFEEHYEK